MACCLLSLNPLYCWLCLLLGEIPVAGFAGGADIRSNLCPRPLVARAKSGYAGCDDAKLDFEEAPVPISYATVGEVGRQSLGVQDRSDDAARACSDHCHQ